MSSIALKFTSLAIRTLSKPIANYIKKQAREHPGFRKTCIGFAQSIHRVDMRWRIGLLQDSAALERQAKRHAAEDAAKRQKASIPTVKTEAQTKADEEAATKGESSSSSSSNDPSPPKPKIRPLSEAKAIETGANFISETFLFSVAAGLILFESWRSRRKETNRREDVKERLDDLEESEKAARRALIELEHEVLRLRAAGAKDGSKNNSGTVAALQKRILPREVYDPPKDDSNKAERDMERGWFGRIANYITSRDQDTDVEGASTTTSTTTPMATTNNLNEGNDNEAQDVLDANSPGPAEKILVESDKELEEKHRQQRIADEEAAAKKAASVASSSPLSALKKLQKKEDKA